MMAMHELNRQALGFPEVLGAVVWDPTLYRGPEDSEPSWFVAARSEPSGRARRHHVRA